MLRKFEVYEFYELVIQIERNHYNHVLWYQIHESYQMIVIPWITSSGGGVYIEKCKGSN